MRVRAALLLIAVAALATMACDEGAAAGCPDPPLRLRNPRTMLCEALHPPSITCPDQPEPPTWAACGACTAIRDQASCLATPGCRAAYDTCLLFDDECYLGGGFGCFGVDRGGPVAGACETLDAADCSSRDDCAAWYQRRLTCTEEDPEERPYVQPQNGTCAVEFANCAVEPAAPLG